MTKALGSRRVFTSAMASVLAGFALSPVAGIAADAPLLRIGDVLAVTVYETVDLPVAASSDKTKAQSVPQPSTQKVVYPRTDLSGEYHVEPHGEIDLPTLGPVTLYGRGIEEVKADLLEKFAKATGRQADVHIAILARAPVYVTGDVRREGAFPFSTGMMVVQAVAMAGGQNTGAQVALAVREIYANTKSPGRESAQLQTLLARQAVLAAGRDEISAVTAPQRLRDLAGDVRAKKLLAEEVQFFELRRQTQASGPAAKAIEDLRAELKRLEKRLADATMEQKRGTRESAAQDQDRRRALATSVATAREQLARAQVRGDQERDLYKLEIAADIAHITLEIAKLEATLRAAGPEGDRPCCERASSGLEIVRSAPTGTEIIDVTETDRLEPGDIVRVGRVGQ